MTEHRIIKCDGCDKNVSNELGSYVAGRWTTVAYSRTADKGAVTSQHFCDKCWRVGMGAIRAHALSTEGVL